MLVLFFIADVTDSDWIISFDPNWGYSSEIQPICGQPFFFFNSRLIGRPINLLICEKKIYGNK